MSEIFLCPRGQLDDRTRRELRKVGVVPVEVDDPSQCQFLRASEIVSADDMLWAVLDALSIGKYGEAGKQREQLSRNLLSIVVAKRAPQP
jgi:hypothetical protein